MSDPKTFTGTPFGLAPIRAEGAEIGPDDPLRYGPNAKQQQREKPEAYYDLDIPFGHVTHDVEGKRWVFCGWSPTTVSMEAYFIRELQPGERASTTSPWAYHCTTTETLLKKFPLLTYVRK